jgi:hypothetical protein
MVHHPIKPRGLLGGPKLVLLSEIKHAGFTIRPPRTHFLFVFYFLIRYYLSPVAAQVEWSLLSTRRCHRAMKRSRQRQQLRTHQLSVSQVHSDRCEIHLYVHSEKQRSFGFGWYDPPYPGVIMIIFQISLFWGVGTYCFNFFRIP